MSRFLRNHLQIIVNFFCHNPQYLKSSQNTQKKVSNSSLLGTKLHNFVMVFQPFQPFQPIYRGHKAGNPPLSDPLTNPSSHFEVMIILFHIVFHDHSDKEIHKTFRRNRYQAELILNLMQILYKIQNNKYNNNFLIEILHYG